MALVYPGASISPSKLDLLEAWVPTQPWGGTGLTQVGAYRFDDPAGEVGIETFLLAGDDGRTLQVPLTFRGAPLDGVDPITEMSHTVLGPRWIYDGLVDQACVAAFASTIVTGGRQAAVEYDDEQGVRRVRDPQVHVAGSGSVDAEVPDAGPLRTLSDEVTSTVSAGAFTLTLARVVPLGEGASDARLTGTWPGQDLPATLAALTLA